MILTKHFHKFWNLDNFENFHKMCQSLACQSLAKDCNSANIFRTNPDPPISDTSVLKEYSGYSLYTLILVSLASIMREHNLTSSPSPVADFCAAFNSSVTFRFLKSNKRFKNNSKFSNDLFPWKGHLGSFETFLWLRNFYQYMVRYILTSPMVSHELSEQRIQRVG